MKKNLLFILIIQCIGSLYAQPSSNSPINYEAVIPNTNLIAWFPFSGNTLDNSGNGNNGTNNGATLTTDRFGNANNAYSFDGITNYVQINLNSINNYLPTNTAITSVVWVKTADQNGPLVSLRGGDSVYDFNIGTLADIVVDPGRYGILVRDDQTCCGTGNNIFGSSVADNNWHMLAVVRNSLGTITCYKDGKLEATSISGQSGSMTFKYMALGAELLWILEGGKIIDNNIGQLFYKGILDDVRIYGKALNISEIQALYNETNVGTPLPLILTSLNAKAIITGNQINWGIANVTNVKTITIERSGADKNFTPLAILATTITQHIDNNPLNGDNYYRLRSTDYNGSTNTYDKIAFVKGLRNEINFYPNPITSGVLNVVAGSAKLQYVAVFNLNGKKVVFVNSINSPNKVALNTHGLAKGVYLLEICSEKSTIIKKVIVN